MTYSGSGADLLQRQNELSWGLRQNARYFGYPDGKETLMTEQLSLITTGVVFAFLGAIVIGLL